MCWAGDFWSGLCFIHHFTFWNLIISRINGAWLYKGHGDSDWQLNVDLAQSVEHWHDNEEVLGLFSSSPSMLVGFCQNLAEIDELQKNSIDIVVFAKSLMVDSDWEDRVFLAFALCTKLHKLIQIQQEKDFTSFAEFSHLYSKRIILILVLK